MKKKTIFAMALTLLILVILTGVTTSWFISLRETPLGTVNSALVRYLPETKSHSIVDVLTYGNMISGYSVDEEGNPLILPGDRLLAGETMVVADGMTTRTVRTSTARDFIPGETVGTVIHGQVRLFYVDPANPSETFPVTRTQRDIMEVSPATTQWYLGSTPIEDPALRPIDYDIVALSDTTVSKGTTPIPYTETTLTLTTTYTQRADPTVVYHFVRTTVTKLVHHPATVDITTVTWDDTAAYAPHPIISYDETILSIPDGKTKTFTRSRMLITETRPARPGEVTTTTEQSIPLQVSNHSTTESNLRMGITVTLTHSDGTNLALMPKVLNDVTYFGTTTDKGQFVELLSITRDGSWVPTTDHTATTTGAVGSWQLYDLTVLDGAGAPTTIIPPVLPTEAVPHPAPVFYTAVKEFGTVVESNFGMTNTDFELAFNDLYCRDIPVIHIRLSVFAKQSLYMDWTEFYTKTLTFTPTP